MRVLYDYRCHSCDTRFEALENRGTNTVSCKVCSAPAHRVLTVPNFRLNGADPGFPTAYDRWARDHEKGAGKNYPRNM